MPSMTKVLIAVACLLALVGGAYLVDAPAASDPEAVAVAEALALHTRALKTAMAEECADARERLTEWRHLKEAGTPSPDDTKQARRMLRKLVKSGCRGQG